MAMTLSMPNFTPQGAPQPRITVVGVGGAGGNAVNNMIQSDLGGVEFIVSNTDAQALNYSLAQRRLQLGAAITQGLGAGSQPDVGMIAAQESIEEIVECLQGSHMVFVTAGMGGGTGTGAAPVIAKVARELGILTVGVVTKPFQFEGRRRMSLAEAGIAELQKNVDTLIVIPNQNLFRIANERTTFKDAFRMADEVLHAGVRGITDLIVRPGIVNLDFNDIRAIMNEMGKAMMGTGEASGDRRALDAAEAAISNPLLDDASMKGARGVLISISGGMDLTLFEIDEAANRIRDDVDPDANIIFGTSIDESMDGRMRVTVVATGMDSANQIQGERKPQLSLVGEQERAPAPEPTPIMAPPSVTRGGYNPGVNTGSHGGFAPAAPPPAPHVFNAGQNPGGGYRPHAQAQDSQPQDYQSGGESYETGHYMTDGANALAVQYEPNAAHNSAQSVAQRRTEPLKQEGARYGQQAAPAAPLTADKPYLPPRPMQPSAQAPVEPARPAPIQQPTLGAVAAQGEPDPFTLAAEANGVREPAPRRGNSLLERVTGAGKRLMTPKETVEPRPQPQQQQPTLGALESRGRFEPTTPGDDLEIPAFLRRQAN